MEDEEEPEEEDDDDQAKVENEEESATRNGSRRGSTRRTRRRPTPRKGSRRGSTRVWVLTVMWSFLSRRPPRRTTMTIQTRWRMMKHLPPRKKPGRRTTRGTSDTIPTGKYPDREVDVWVEYQAAMQDPMFAY